MDCWRIMIVDDEEDIRELIKASLETEFEVVEAYDGLDALDKLKVYQPDFIIMDVMMPLMNGLETSIAIRENPRFNDVPILFLSALSTREDMHKAYRSGADLYLTKPIDPSHLITTIKNFLNKSPSSPREKKYSIQQVQDRMKKEKPAVEISEFQKIASRQPQPTHKESPYQRQQSTNLPRVMVVDDEQDMVDFIRLSLRDNFEVVSASDGISAIKKALEYQPDIFILDIMLPKMSGYQLCQSLRRNRTYMNAPIIMISAKSSSRDKDYARRMGADDYLTKPFHAKRLIDLVFQAIQKRHMTIRDKKISIVEIEEKQKQQEQTFEEKDERFLKRTEESEIQKLIRRELEKDKKSG